MATGVNVWSKTAATNNTADSAVNWQEGQAPSSVNDSARGMMAATAKWRDDLNGSVTTAGSSTAYTASSNQSFASLTAGIEIACQFDEDCGATVTLNVDGLGAKPLRSAAGVELVAGAIKAGSVHRATYFTSNSGEWLLHEVNPTIIAAGQVVTASIADDAVTYAKMQNVSATSRVIGRKTSGAGDAEELTGSEALDFVGSTRGNVLVRGASTWGATGPGTQGQVLRSDGTDVAMGTLPILHVREEQANNTNTSCNFTNAAWSTLVLNTTKTNEINSASLSSNQITLPAGTYFIDALVPCYQTGGSGSIQKIRLRNTTNSTSLLVSQTWSTTGGGAAGVSMPCALRGRFTLSGTGVLELQFWQNNGTGALIGGTRSASYSEIEVYSEALIYRVT